MFVKFFSEIFFAKSSAWLRQQYGDLASKLGFMPSEEFIAHQKAMAEAAAANPPPEFKTEQERRDHIDKMLGQRPLADGVVAKEIDADGIYAIGLAPEGVADNAPGICYFHGDGYRTGSAKACSLVRSCALSCRPRQGSPAQSSDALMPAAFINCL